MTLVYTTDSQENKNIIIFIIALHATRATLRMLILALPNICFKLTILKRQTINLATKRPGKSGYINEVTQ